MSLKRSRTRGEWLQEWATVVAHEAYSDVYKLTLQSPEIARRAVAGQFVEVKVATQPGAVDPLLRRPISIAEIRPEQGEITLIYRAVGRGTRMLAAVEPGGRLDLLGPLGNSFPDPAAGSGQLVLVGGGLGIPPMVAAAQRAVAAGRQVSALVGARSREYLAGLAELKATGIPVVVATEDGSLGRQGLVTQPLAEAIQAGVVDEIWACGPEALLSAVKQLAGIDRLPCFLSLERFMACGFGACIGCTVPKAGGGGYLKTCQDGPVFAAEEVDLGV